MAVAIVSGFSLTVQQAGRGYLGEASPGEPLAVTFPGCKCPMAAPLIGVNFR